MESKVGIDLVYIPRFAKTIETRGENFLKKIFLESELSQGFDVNHLAGIFAGKEAVIKALSLEIGSWLKIRIFEQKSGEPKVQLLHKQYQYLLKIVLLLAKFLSCTVYFHHRGHQIEL